MDIQVPNAHLTRQLDLIPVECLGERVTIIGAGAVGSFTALAMAKMGFTNITVFDDDKVDIENMNCSLYRLEDVGKLKVTALAELLKSFTNVHIEAIAKRYEGGTFSGIVLCCVDSMKARKLVWDNHRGVAAATKAIIDPRMGAEMALMYVMDPMSEKDRASYESNLYTDEEAVHEKCTAKATVYTAQMLSGLVAKAAKDVAMGIDYPRITMWSIKDDEFKAWRTNKNELH